MARSERAALCIASALVLAACGFPTHQFIPDNQFDDASTAGGTSGTGGGVTGGSGGTGGTGGTSGTGGSITGGSGGTSGSGGTGGSAGSGGSAGGGGTAGAAGGENCTNGVDDNNNGKVDCADPACASIATCAPTVSGWNGPVALWKGSGTATQPKCLNSGGYPTSASTVFSGIVAPPASCPTCQCGSVQGATCPGTADLCYYSDGACQSSSGWGDCISGGSALSINPGACNTLTLGHGPNGEAPGSVVFQAAPSGGSCTPQPSGQKTTAPVTWTNQILLCGGAPTTGGGCGANAACVPDPNAPFTFVCVYQDGSVACPSQYNAHRYVYYKSNSDNRGCSTCTCASPSGGQCNSTVTDATDNSCSVQTTTVPAGTCTAVKADSTPGTYQGSPADTRSVKFTVGSPTVGYKCAPQGDQPTGSAAPTNPVTICCE